MSDRRVGIHAGHRERMREKLSVYGRDVFHTHELLEMILYNVIPYKNTNPIAKGLLKRFGCLDGVLSATREELLSAEGVGPKAADMLLTLGKITPETLAEKGEEATRTFDDFSELGRFFADYFSDKGSYEVALMLLNSKLEYLSFVSLYAMDYSSGGVKADRFIEEALKARASVAVIAHNHPFGPAFPSAGDIATNNMIEASLSGVGIMLLEHYVVSGGSFTGFMKHLDAPFSQPVEIGRFLRSKETLE